jgi:hypothetical protein
MTLRSGAAAAAASFDPNPPAVPANTTAVPVAMKAVVTTAMAKATVRETTATLKLLFLISMSVLLFDPGIGQWRLLYLDGVVFNYNT